MKSGERLRARQGFGVIMRDRLGVFPALIVVMALLACEQAVEQPPPSIRLVRTQTVFATSGARTRSFTGAAKAGIESKISFKVSGTLQQLLVEVGDVVREGQLIAEIDPRDYELQVEEAEASLAHTRAQAVNAQANFQRVRGLFERANSSQADYDSARAGQDSARALVRSIEKKLELSQLQLSYTRLKSPIDGAIAEVPVEVNEYVEEGDTIALLNAGARPEVEVAIPEVLIREIRRDTPVRVTFDAIPNQQISGRVTQVAVAATAGLKTYPVTVLLDRPDARILPGMAAEVSFRFGSGDEPLRYILPPHAVREDREGKFVYVVTETGDGVGTVERRPVVVGELVGESLVAGLEVLEGLSDGERVVTVGASRIEDGQQVRLQEADPD